MKQFFTLLLSALIMLVLVDNPFFNNKISEFFRKDYYQNNLYTYNIASNLDYFKSNKYYKDDLSNYVDMTEDFYPKNKQELLNTYYTILNNGWEKFSYYCDKKYTNCLKDIQSLSQDNKEFSFMNQLLNPYNSFESIISNYNSDGRIDVEVNRKYTDEEIKNIDNELNTIINGLNINEEKTIKEKIRLFHDYLANRNIYDSDKANGESMYHSDSAIGALFEGHAICSGYTDAMSLFLDKINVENYKVANDEHTWNAVKIDNGWYHIDLTWDDPIVSTGENVILYDYFLISTNNLKNKNEKDHFYSEEIYNFIN